MRPSPPVKTKSLTWIQVRPISGGQRQQTCLRYGYSCGRTMDARDPLGPDSDSNSTDCPTNNDSNGVSFTAETWKKRSFPLLSPAMNPKPRSATNFLIVPCCIAAILTQNIRETSTSDPSPVTPKLRSRAEHGPNMVSNDGNRRNENRRTKLESDLEFPDTPDFCDLSKRQTAGIPGSDLSTPPSLTADARKGHSL